MIRYLLISLLSVVIFSQDKLPNDIRWVRESGEYAALCEQTFKLAWESLRSDLRSAPIQVAIVMDLDETVLDNSMYQVEITDKGEGFTMETWVEWVNRAHAGAVTGVKSFIVSFRTVEYVYFIIIVIRRV